MSTNYIMALVIMGIVMLVLIAICVFMWLMWRMCEHEIRTMYLPVDVPDIKWNIHDSDETEGDDEFYCEV